MVSKRIDEVVGNQEEGFNLAKAEEEILKFWETNQVFEKSLAKRKNKKTFVFYEGPPYANGKPGIHHVLARVVKDIILRYKSMRGCHVPRRAGWDTHGLPVEIAAEKALGLKSKKDIEKFGIKLFNQKAKEAVWIYKDEWENMTRRIGYWLDFKNAYVTYEPEYIETVWWTLSQIAKRKLLYKGHKVVPWCTRCGTALSSHELALGYKEVEDNSVYVKFKLKPGQRISKDFVSDDKTYILSWTTTPWTLPGNVALAVNSGIKYWRLTFSSDYQEFKSGETYIASEKFFNLNYRGIADWNPNVGSEGIIRRFSNDSSVHINSGSFWGNELTGKEYSALFGVPKLQDEKSHRIYEADFVLTDEGTGVVHTAVMYGENDYELGKKMGLPQHHTVDGDGRFTKDVRGFEGLYVKARETEEKIVKYLRDKEFLLKEEKVVHEYPFCWRCETPVLYYARTSWFIAMSKLREKLLNANEKINWIPEHVKHGRFGGWLKEAKDWNLSRERYWGVPLPIWECRKCGEAEVVGGLDELSEKALQRGSGRAGGAENKYWVMRHGESETNVFGVIDSGQGKFHLTAKGRKQAELSAAKLKKELNSKGEKIDIIFSSDVTRTRETEKIVAATLGVKDVIFDKRLEEIHLGSLSGCHDKKYHELFPTYESRFEKSPEGGESLHDLRARLWNFLQDIEKKHDGKNFLIVSHEYPIWMLYHIALGWSEKKAIAEKIARGDDFLGLAEFAKLDFKIVPRNDGGEVDLHRPYTDEILLSCSKCGGQTERVKEVADVWYDSGAMPFASQMSDVRNWKPDIRNLISEIRYPADYIAEGSDQTRGWFYTLLAVATALGYKAPYKNVISLGLINDGLGQKMSKSKGNIVDPWAVIGKYGADAVRWYFYTVNPPGEPKNFDEAEIAKAFRRMHLIFYNSVVFYKTYAGAWPSTGGGRQALSKNVLDKWILAGLDRVVAGATGDLEKYQIREAALKIEGFIDDLSRWYIRRSRRRFQPSRRLGAGEKPSGQNDYKSASATLRFVLIEATKLLAPFTPFFAEYLYENLGMKESVHLADWPAANGKSADGKLLGEMGVVRKLAALGLAKRAEAGIKVRQPLASLTVKTKLNKELANILADEVNVKNVFFSSEIDDEVELDTKITPELREEGILREFVRVVQDLRQKARLRPNDKIALLLQLAKELRKSLVNNEKLLKAEIGAQRVEYGKSQKFDAEIETKIDGENVWVGIRKM